MRCRCRAGTPDDPASRSSTFARPAGRRVRDRNRPGRAECRGSGWSGRRRARTGPGRATGRRRDRGASRSGRAGRPAGQGSWPCRDGRCRPSAPRRRPEAGPCRRPSHQSRSSRRRRRSGQAPGVGRSGPGLGAGSSSHARFRNGRGLCSPIGSTEFRRWRSQPVRRVGVLPLAVCGCCCIVGGPSSAGTAPIMNCARTTRAESPR
jgi:hypothetical protein